MLTEATLTEATLYALHPFHLREECDEKAKTK